LVWTGRAVRSCRGQIQHGVTHETWAANRGLAGFEFRGVSHPPIIVPRAFPPFMRSSSSRRSASFSSRSALSSSLVRPSTGAVDGVAPREGAPSAPMIIIPELAGPLPGVPSSGGSGEALASPPNGVPSRPVLELSRGGSRLPVAYRLCARARWLERDAPLPLLPVRCSDEPCIARRVRTR